MTATPWQINDEREPLRGPVIRALLEHRDRLMAIDPWLAFPQTHCSFSFGADGRPLPIGVLFALWDNCSEMVGLCPGCGDDGYGYAFGGGLAVGGIIGACSACHCQLWRGIGGLATVGRILSPYLEGTSSGETAVALIASALAVQDGYSYFFKSGSLGGTVGSDGRELLGQLRLLGVRL